MRANALNTLMKSTLSLASTRIPTYFLLIRDIQNKEDKMILVLPSAKFTIRSSIRRTKKLVSELSIILSADQESVSENSTPEDIEKNNQQTNFQIKCDYPSSVRLCSFKSKRLLSSTLQQSTVQVHGISVQEKPN